tara:strand:- start:2968 stop:3252 length:285 start_codon:yes stop_codon:yes gene_type:complete
MNVIDSGKLFNYSNIKFTASYNDINERYLFIINRLLIKLNAFIAKKSSSVEVYHVEISGECLPPILHLVIKGKISNRELDAYLDYWTSEFKKIT